MTFAKKKQVSVWKQENIAVKAQSKFYPVKCPVHPIILAQTECFIMSPGEVEASTDKVNFPEQDIALANWVLRIESINSKSDEA